MNWLVVSVAAAAALGVTMMVVAVIEERAAKRWAAMDRRVRYLEEMFFLFRQAQRASGDNKGLSVERTTTDLGSNGLKNGFHAGWRNGRCKGKGL